MKKLEVDMTVIESLNVERELPFKRNNKDKNADIFTNWLRGRIEAVCRENDIEKMQNQTYDVTAVFLHRDNNDYIQKHVDPLVFLSFSPCDDSSLQHDEISFDLDRIIINNTETRS